MSWKTLIIRDSEKISLFLNNIVINKNEMSRKFFIGDLNCVMIEDYKSIITTRILSKLASYNVLVILCNEKYEPSAIIQPLVGHHEQLRIMREQINWSLSKKRILWTEIVKQKIQNQVYILEVNTSNPEKIKKLQDYVMQVELGDSTNREGHAAKVYFNELFGNSFSRDNDDLLINSGLNYGYTILRSAFCRAIVSKGLHPSLSIFHFNRYDSFALADDLMEPFRPIVDHFVYNHHSSWKHFGLEEKESLVNLLNSQIEFEGKTMYLTTAISSFVDKIINFMSEANAPQVIFPMIKNPIEYEL